MGKKEKGVSLLSGVATMAPSTADEDDSSATERTSGPSSTGDSPSNGMEGTFHHPSTSTSVLIHRHAHTNGHSSSFGSTAEIPFVSGHRKDLDRIRDDAMLAKIHPVPYGADRSDEKGSPNEWPRRIKGCCSDSLAKKRSVSDWVETFLPCWGWLKCYRWKSDVLKDIIAGLTVGVMVVPQGMSYAKLAGLPVQFGLYSAFIPVYVYSFFGSSRQLAIGPVAITSLLLSSGLAPIMEKRGIAAEDPNYEEVYTQLAIQVSFLVGVIYIVAGIARLGFITLFLSHTVISGFTSGAAVIIGLGQVKYIFGYDIPRSDTVQEILINLFNNISEFNYKTFLMGTFSLGLLVSFKQIGGKYPKYKFLRCIGPLTVTVIGIILVAAFNLDEKGFPVVAEIPRGLPPLTVSQWTPIESFVDMIMVLATIGVVGFMESVAIAKQIARKHTYHIDSSMELIGLGMANFVGGMFSAYPVTGSFSRSAVNNESGAISGFASMITATLVGLVLLFLTAIFELLPLCIIGAIIIAGVVSLVDYPEAIKLWKIHKVDFLVWLVAFVCVMFLGAEIGLLISVVLALLIVLGESAFPNMSMLGRLPGTTAYRNIEQYAEVEVYRGCIITRIDESLYFANAQSVCERILKKCSLAAEADDGREAKYLIIDISPVARIDASAIHALEDMRLECQSRGLQICFVNPSLTVVDRFDLSGFADRIGREYYFSSTYDAVNRCLSEMDNEAPALSDAEGIEVQDDEIIQTDRHDSTS